MAPLALVARSQSLVRGGPVISPKLPGLSARSMGVARGAPLAILATRTSLTARTRSTSPGRMSAAAVVPLTGWTLSTSPGRGGAIGQAALGARSMGVGHGSPSLTLASKLALAARSIGAARGALIPAFSFPFAARSMSTATGRAGLQGVIRVRLAKAGGSDHAVGGVNSTDECP